MSMFSKVIITIPADVRRSYNHFDPTVVINVVGDATPLAQILADGAFGVSVEVTEENKVTKVVKP